MKNLHTLFALILSSISFAQSPQNLAVPGVTSIGAGTNNVTKFPGSLFAPNVGGTFYASQYPGQSNTGITSTFADDVRCGASGSGGVGGCTVIADPAYPAKEQPYMWYNRITFPSPINTHFIDRRRGTETHIIHDPPWNSFTWGTDFNVNACINTTNDSHYNYLLGGVGWGGPAAACQRMLGLFSAPGVNYGTPAKGPGGWSLQAGLSVTTIANSPGIAEAFSVNQTKAGVGDTTNYIYHSSYGGAVAGSDEGSHAFSYHMDEPWVSYTGTIATGGTNATTIKINCKSDCFNPGDGRYDINLTKGYATGHVTAITMPSVGVPGTLTIDSAVNPSTFWGTLAADVVTPTASFGIGYTPMTFTVKSGSGNTGAPVVGDLVCFNSEFHEQARITAVSGAGPWSITVPLRHAHNAGSWVVANGPCGSFIDFAANDIAWSGSTIRYPIDIAGAKDAHTLFWYWYTLYQNPANATFGHVTGQVVVPSGTYKNVGGILTLPREANAYPWTTNSFLIGQPVITISGATDTSFNGQCTNVTPDPNNNYIATCTQASSTGHTSVESKAKIAIGTDPLGNSGFTLYPGAELLDMQDYNATGCAAASLTVPCNDGTHTLEPNNTVWAAGDTVVNAHHYSGVFGGTHEYVQVFNPMSAVGGRDLALIGAGNHGNSPEKTWTINYAADKIRNETANSTYVGHGGILHPPGGFALGGDGGNGLFGYGLAMYFAPDPIASPFLYVGCPQVGCASPGYYYNLFELGTNGGYGTARYFPYSNTLSWYMKMDAMNMTNSTVYSSKNGTAASMGFTSVDSGSGQHKWTITAPLTGGGYTLTLPQKTGTLATSADLVAMVASGALHASGLVPDPGPSAGTAKFLREDATWKAPPAPVKIGNSITPAAVKASQCVEQTFTYTGLSTGQGVWVSPPASLGAHIWIGSTRVAATNTLAIAFCADATAGTPPAGTYIAVAF